MKAIEILKNFVEEKLSTEELENSLYSNQELISLLENTKAKPYMNSNSTYEYLISQDLTSLDAKLNLMDIFREILDYKHIPYSSNSTTEKNFDLILEAIPNWIPADMGYLNSLYDKYQPKTVTIFKKIIKEHFICMDKHPKWLQEPDWPIVDNIPAMFLGQLDISKLKHDTTYLYIFWDKKNKQIYRSNTGSINEQAVANEIYNSDVECEWNARTRLLLLRSPRRGSRIRLGRQSLLQEIHPYGRYIYIYTNLDSYDPLAQVRDWTTEDGEGVQQAHYFHCDQIGIPREMTDDEGKLVSFLQKKMKILVFFSPMFPLKSGKRILNLKNLKIG